MLVTIAAAAAAVALAPAERPASKAVAAASPRLAIAPTKPAATCKGDPRMVQARHERAIYLLNPQDRAKRLIEMPVAEACLLGGSR